MTDQTYGHAVGLRCIRCEHVIPFQFPVYRCDQCGGNLQVEYDWAAIGHGFLAPDAATRLCLGHLAYGEFLPLDPSRLPDFRLTVGPTPLVPAPELAQELGLEELWFKDDTRLPSGSFKDRASSVLVSLAQQQGVEVVSTASTGNAGCSLACLCADQGMKAVVFVPRQAPRAKVAQLLAYGALVVQVDGKYDDAFDLCWTISRKRGWLNRSTGWNPLTREGKKTVSFEISQDLNWNPPDLVSVSVGDGNILSGTWKGFQDLYRSGVISTTPRILAVQSSSSDAVARGVERFRRGEALRSCIEPVVATTRADSISVDDPRDGEAAVRAIVESMGDVATVSDARILETMPMLARRTGIFAEPAAATATAGLMEWLKQCPRKQRPRRVVVLVTGNGLKDVDAYLDRGLRPLRVPNDEAHTDVLLEDALQNL